MYLFRYMFNPKNFGVISSFLPNKVILSTTMHVQLLDLITFPLQSPTDCVLYYYLSKKREKFKHLVRKTNFKRKKPFVKPADFSNSSLTPSSRHHHMPLSLFPSTKTKTELLVISPEQDREASAVQSGMKSLVML